MKRIDGYQCENCGEIHDTEAEALACEQSHKDRMSEAKIVYGKFRSKEGTYGFDHQNAQQVPTTVTVRFSEARGDFGIYRLEHYGFKGV